MTNEEAKKLLPDIFTLEKYICGYCNKADVCGNCPYRKEKKKVEKLNFERILKIYADNDGNMKKVLRYIRKAAIK